MLRINRVVGCCISSIILHVLFFLFIDVCRKEKLEYNVTPIEVTFYTTEQDKEEGKELDLGEEKEVEIVGDKKEKEEEVKEEERSKEEVIVKKKKEREKKEKERKEKKKEEKGEDKKKKEVVGKKKEEKKEKKKEGVEKALVDKGNEKDGNLKSERAEKNGSVYMGASIESSDFKYPYYISQVRRKVGGQWRWAESYENLRVLLYFKINRDGSVRGIEIKESSGNEEYNRNAIDTIRRAAPFGELPEGYEGESLGVFFEFKY